LLNSAVVFKTFASGHYLLAFFISIHNPINTVLLGTKVLQLKKLDEEEVLRRISSLFCSADQAVFDKCRSFTIAAYSLYSALPVALGTALVFRFSLFKSYLFVMSQRTASSGRATRHSLPG
jgi:hypothetical protein